MLHTWSPFCWNATRNSGQAHGKAFIEKTNESTMFFEIVVFKQQFTIRCSATRRNSFVMPLRAASDVSSRMMSHIFIKIHYFKSLFSQWPCNECLGAHIFLFFERVQSRWITGQMKAFNALLGKRYRLLRARGSRLSRLLTVALPRCCNPALFSPESWHWS